MSDMAIIGIVYDEPDPETYGGVSLKMMPEGKREDFYTGDPTVDYLTAGIVAKYRLKGGPVMGSSSVDHFSMDGGDLEDEDPPQHKLDLSLVLARKYLTDRGEGPKEKSA